MKRVHEGSQFHQSPKGRESHPYSGRIEWSYTVGPARRSWRWYLTVLTVGLGLAGLLWLVDPHDSWGPFTMLLWIPALVSMSLIPNTDYEAGLDRQWLTVRRVGRHRALEYDLSEFATYKVVEDAGDRLNAFRSLAVLRPKDGSAPVDLVLPDDRTAAHALLARIADVVDPAPDIAPTPLERFETRFNRWIGWR